MLNTSLKTFSNKLKTNISLQIFKTKQKNNNQKTKKQKQTKTNV